MTPPKRSDYLLSSLLAPDHVCISYPPVEQGTIETVSNRAIKVCLPSFSKFLSIHGWTLYIHDMLIMDFSPPWGQEDLNPNLYYL